MEHTPMTPFDLLTSSESMRMLKLLLPFTSPSNQRSLALFIKFSEFQQTQKFFYGFPENMESCDLDQSQTAMGDILSSIKEYLPPAQKEAIDSMTQMMQMMNLFSQMNSDISEGGEEDGDLDEPSQFSENGSNKAEANPDSCDADFGEIPE